MLSWILEKLWIITKKNASVKIAQNFVKDYELNINKILHNPFFQVHYKNFRGLSSNLLYKIAFP